MPFNGQRCQRGRALSLMYLRHIGYRKIHGVIGSISVPKLVLLTTAINIYYAGSIRSCMRTLKPVAEVSQSSNFLPCLVLKDYRGYI